MSPEHAHFCREAPSWLPKRRYDASQRAGKRYEEWVLRKLEETYQGWLLPSPWITFFRAGRWNWIQPDALIVRPDLGVVGVVEVKLSHVAKAWKQMWEQYVPVLRVLFPRALWQIKCTEVCKNFNPMIRMPGPSQVVMRPFEHDWNVTGVCCWAR